MLIHRALWCYISDCNFPLKIPVYCLQDTCARTQRCAQKHAMWGWGSATLQICWPWVFFWLLPWLLPCPYTIYLQMLHFHICNRKKLSLHSCWVCLWCPAQPYSTAIPPTDMGTARQRSALCLLLKGPVRVADQCLTSPKTEGNTLKSLSFLLSDQTKYDILVICCWLQDVPWGGAPVGCSSCPLHSGVTRGVLKPYWSRRPILHSKTASKMKKQASKISYNLAFPSFFFCFFFPAWKPLYITATWISNRQHRQTSPRITAPSTSLPGLWLWQEWWDHPGPISVYIIGLVQFS